MTRKQSAVWQTLLYLALALVCSVWFLNLNLGQDPSKLMPQEPELLVKQYEWTKAAPVSKRLIIAVKSEQGNLNALLRARDHLAAALPKPWFEKTLIQIDPKEINTLQKAVLAHTPVLLSDPGWKSLMEKCTPEGIAKTMQEGYRRLATSGDTQLANRLARDPFGIEAAVFRDFRFLNVTTGVHSKAGGWVTPDGKHALFFGWTPVSITDAKGCKDLYAEFDRAVAQSLPKGMTAFMYSGHAHTLENMHVIKEDLNLIFLVTSVALVFLFFAFFRSLKGMLVFLLPLFILSPAAVATHMVFGRLSAMTLGFGAVLLGISLDFGIHVFLGNCAKGSTASLRKAILTAGITTIGGFLLLCFSSVPVHREVAIFSSVGLLLALGLALGPLSYWFVPSVPPVVWPWGLPKGIVTCWLLLLALALGGVPSVTLEGDLRKLGYRPDSLLAKESYLKKIWLGKKDRAMIFSVGQKLEDVLEKNDALFTYFSKRLEPGALVSAAPLFPSVKTQQNRANRWVAFFSGTSRKDLFARLGEEGQEAGFVKEAFRPFFSSVTRAPEMLAFNKARGFAGGALLETFLVEHDQEWAMMTMVPDLPDVWQGVVGEEGIVVVSPERFKQMFSQSMWGEFVDFLTRAGLLVILLLWWRLKRVKKVLMALLPAVSGLLLQFGLMGYFAMPLHYFNMVSVVLVLALGVDYGVFMIQGDPDERAFVRQGVLLSGLTTIFAFGALALARHPALHDLGLSVTWGIAGALATALFVLPVFQRST